VLLFVLVLVSLESPVPAVPPVLPQPLEPELPLPGRPRPVGVPNASHVNRRAAASS